MAAGGTGGGNGTGERARSGFKPFEATLVVILAALLTCSVIVLL